MICERVVSFPTRLALHFIKPERFIVALETSSPGFLSTGILSPVKADSFIAVFPSRITPSTGIFSPGRTIKISPTQTSSISTSTSFPSRRRVAVFGESFIKLFKASVVFPLEIDSKSFPTVIRVKIIAALSK